MDVTFYTRPKTAGQYSLERVLKNLIGALAGRVRSRIWRQREGVWGLATAPGAALAQGDVNHIAGHVHYLAGILDRNRTVLTIHDIGHLGNVRPSLSRLYRIFWYEMPLSRVAAVITVSEFTKREVVREFGVRPEKIRVIHNCVPSGFAAATREFDAGEPTILVVGTAPHKNARRLVEAITGIKCRIVFVGRVYGDLRGALESGRVDFEERVDVSDAELAECYRHSDVVYFASTYEGFGIPIVEAHAVGRPVITSNICSMPEVAGDAALLVDPYDVAAIRQAVCSLFASADLRAELVERGFANAKRFDRETFAGAHLEVYRHVAA